MISFGADDGEAGGDSAGEALGVSAVPIGEELGEVAVDGLV